MPYAELRIVYDGIKSLIEQEKEVFGKVENALLKMELALFNNCNLDIQSISVISESDKTDRIKK